MRISAMVSVLAMAFAVAPMAVAAPGAAQQGYDEAAPLGSVQGADGDSGTEGGEPVVQTAGTAPGTLSASDDSVLPFTGLELAIMFLLGATLVGTGFLLRRAARRTNA